MRKAQGADGPVANVVAQIKVGDLTLTVRPLSQAERDRIMPPRRAGQTELLCRAIDAAREAALRKTSARVRLKDGRVVYRKGCDYCGCGLIEHYDRGGGWCLKCAECPGYVYTFEKDRR